MVCLITLVSFYIFSLSIPLWNFGIGMILNLDHDFSRSRTRPSVTTCRRRAIDFWNDDNLHRPVFFFFHSKNKIKQRVTNSFDDFFRETKLQLGITIGREKKSDAQPRQQFVGNYITQVYIARQSIRSCSRFYMDAGGVLFLGKFLFFFWVREATRHPPLLCWSFFF